MPALCVGVRLSVYTYDGATLVDTLPASDVAFSWELGGGGFLRATVDSRIAEIVADPDMLDDCVVKVGVDLVGSGSYTDVAAYANRGRRGLLWDGAGRQTRQIQAPTLWTAWAQDAVLYPEGGLSQASSPERYFGYQSSAYDPDDDASQWGTPSAATGQQDSTSGNRSGEPSGWPSALGDAYWITRGATSNGLRHLFVADCVVSADAYVKLWFSADESCSVYVGGALAVQTSSSETGYLSYSTWEGWLTAGTYRVAIDKTSVVSRGGDGVDPVLLAMATVDDSDAVQSILLVTNDSDWQVCTLDPVNGEAPSMTPGQIVAQLHTEAAARGVDAWSALTLGFTATADSDSAAWPHREERVWRVGYDSHLDMVEGLGDLGFCPEITPSLVLEGWSDRGSDLSGSVTIAALTEADRIDESGVGVSASHLLVETQDGWTEVSTTTAVGRREQGLSLGNAPSISQGRRLGQRVLDERLSRPETEWTVEFYATPGAVPFSDFGLGDTVTVDIGGTGTPRVVLSLAGQAESTEGIVRWTAKTGDAGLGERVVTLGGTATAAGGSSAFTATATMTTTEGAAIGAGGSSTFDGGV